MSDTPEPTGSGPTSASGEAGETRPPRAKANASSGPKASTATTDSASGGEASGADSSSGSTEGAAPKKRRRGSRGGRGRSAASRAAAAAKSAEGEGSASEADSSSAGKRAPSNAASGSSVSGDADQAESTSKSTRPPRPRRSPARKPAESVSATEPIAQEMEAPVADAKAHVSPRPKIGDSRPAVDEIVHQHDEQSGNGADGESTATGPKKRRRRGGRRRSSAGRKPVEALTVDLDAEAIELDAETLEKRKGRERNGRPVGRYLMCVQKRGRATQIAVLEGRSLIEHYVSRPNDDVSQIDGNIYLSKVQNVLPGMEAAFIDIGTPKNAVLYRGDVRYDADDLVEGSKKQSDGARIEQMIKAGQTIVTQVTKNPIGSKGARLTQEVSLPGRFVVLMPNSTTYGISKRLPDDERKRLRKVLDEVKPSHHGIIVRTAAEGVTSDELRRDVQRLVRQWDDIEKLVAKASAPTLLYREPDMAVRIIREEFNKNYRGVIIDDEDLYNEVRDYVASISPELADRIEYFDPNNEPLPLFERYHIHEQLHKGLDRKVWLPSGGSLIIERTEALTVIDVNTGKNVGKSNLEETVFRNNLEAADEIAHQLRLRDIGGIIVIDFIDMEIKKNRDEVLARLRDALARDKTRTQAYPIGELGLVEMTRKRISEGLVESFSENCPNCNGRGFVLDEALLAE